MRGDIVPATNEPRDPRAIRRVVRPAAAPAAAPTEGLERLRECLRQRLDQIESLARDLDRDTSASQECTEREHVLWRRIADLESERDRILAEKRAWEQERESTIEQLEHDRGLLAEAWARVESEQIAAGSTGVSPPGPTARSSHQATSPMLAAGVSPPPDPPRDDAVERAILKQFQALRRDVRKNSDVERPR